MIAFHSVRKLSADSLRPLDLLAVVPAGRVPRRVLVAAGHVLPDEEAQLVAVVIPAGRLDLHVLADHVEAELLGHFEVVLQRLVGRRGVESVGPEALIERAILKQRLVVEHHPRDAGLVLAERDFAHGEVAGRPCRLRCCHRRQIRLRRPYRNGESGDQSLGASRILTGIGCRRPCHVRRCDHCDLSDRRRGLRMSGRGPFAAAYVQLQRWTDSVIDIGRDLE